MRLRIALWGVIALPLLSGAPVHAQTTQPSTDQRFDRLERRIEILEQGLKSRDQEIARLRRELSQRPTTAPTDEIEKTRQDILKDIESREALPITLRTPANFNPDLAVIGDFK